ncbi:hypothetical protein SAMN05443270_1108 [Lacrimispora sphenoides]|nr:hypothetical protein SAMN05443270_1108 [Lacrimispora sphenoides]
MWISKKKWEALEKRVADLEIKSQGRQIDVKLDIPKGNAYDLVEKYDKERNIYSS